MRIRVFSAPHLHEALSKVRKEMGPEALILDRQQSKDASGNSLWHVHAALDAVAPPPAKPVKPAPQPVAEPAQPHPLHADATIRRLERMIEGLGNRESASLRQALTEGADQRAFDLLLKLGVSASHAFDMAPDFARRNPTGSKTIRWGKRINPGEQRHIVLFTGPSGCGKSTLVAKLAAHYSMKGIRVALASTDTERMGGLDSLKAYASTLGIPFFPLRKAADAGDILRQTQSAQLLLIDSEGWSPRRDFGLKRQTALWDAMQCTQRFLVLPANMDEEDGMQLLGHHSASAMTHLAFSKLDETQKPGKIVNWAISAGLPLGYCSFGPEVPEQMGWMTDHALTALLGKTGRDASV
ncbi:GTP-binding protein [Mariprofundus erugo]|uniref:GTP-binding protein n=1 Tax=Mariprofundus erugo TaxID=2528639 RepID=A0A5R9GQM5_9PROT|nr:GTP-binding protein [Mariprofundus erugo]TLS66703.1 GTP-binding protein [Mariprofundus erugo]